MPPRGSALATTGAQNGATGTAITHKTTITPEQALEIVQRATRERWKALKAEGSAALREFEKRVGGRTDAFDASAIEQGRAWAQRLALIARRNAGTSYSPSKTSVAIQAEVKKIYAIVASLEALVANDVEIPLFATATDEEFFGRHHADIRRVTAKEVAQIAQDCADSEMPENREDAFREALFDDMTDAAQEVAVEALAGYTIDIPAAPEPPKKSGKKGRKPANFEQVDGATYHAEEGDEEPEE